MLIYEDPSRRSLSMELSYKACGIPVWLWKQVFFYRNWYWCDEGGQVALETSEVAEYSSFSQKCIRVLLPVMSEHCGYGERMIRSWVLLPAVLCATKAVDELSLSTGSKVVCEDHCVLLTLL